MRSLDSYADSSMSGDSSTFASPTWRRQDSMESGPSSTDEHKSPGVYDAYAPTLTVLSSTFTPSAYLSDLPPPFSVSPPADPHSPME
jgi:hypothetical protein